MNEEQEKLNESLQMEDIQNILNGKEVKERIVVVDNIYDNIKLLSMDINESNYHYGDIFSLKSLYVKTDDKTDASTV